MLYLSLTDSVRLGVHKLCIPQVVHCDLKAKNILLSRDRSLAKIGDVGLARTMFETHLSTASGFFGTFSYAAPEVLLRTRCNEKVCHSASLVGSFAVSGPAQHS